ncbi:nicotinate phosphoribosyltransferase [Thelephora terrestris]|uniref:Nicotinate phosphoribosyltransferase n=1 Tax=Thelephora terrestris TaxID=56493 RepID=A0A9P6H4M1_9AGAM|nr:nicotinate phosphoribosyltransferase [Thelephora terrestris]
MTSADNSPLIVPPSILDTDLYKLTMQQAVFAHFPDVEASYRFTNRTLEDTFTRRCFELFKKSVQEFAKLALSPDERSWLERTCPHLKKGYLDYLQSYRFRPEQVTITFDPLPEDPDRGQIGIVAEGLWVETIMWEVPLMASLSELYFTVVNTDWDYEGQTAEAYSKGKILAESDCIINEFGTRRRRSYKTQDLVVDELIKAYKDTPSSRGQLVGTSNAHLARQYGITPVGTIAHEWFMGVAAIGGYENANGRAMDLWEATYPDVLLVTLTDTFSTEAFYQDFVKDPERAKRWGALRQDSGDPFVYAPRAREIYQSMGIDHTTKMIVYSDGLNVEKALALKKQCDKLGFTASFGIGTSLSNDFKSISSGRKQKSKALNMVIKLYQVGGKYCAKISDELTKNTGNEEAVREAKKVFGINV